MSLFLQIPKEFFTPESMTTLAGATGATFIVCNGSQRAFSFNPKWLGLVVAMIISFAGTLNASGYSPVDLMVATVNGFLIFATAAGSTEALSGVSPTSIASGNTSDTYGSSVTGNGNKRKRKFLQSWFR